MAGMTHLYSGGKFYTDPTCYIYMVQMVWFPWYITPLLLYPRCCQQS